MEVLIQYSWVINYIEYVISNIIYNDMRIRLAHINLSTSHSLNIYITIPNFNYYLLLIFLFYGCSMDE